MRELLHLPSDRKLLPAISELWKPALVEHEFVNYGYNLAYITPSGELLFRGPGKTISVKPLLAPPRGKAIDVFRARKASEWVKVSKKSGLDPVLLVLAVNPNHPILIDQDQVYLPRPEVISMTCASGERLAAFLRGFEDPKKTRESKKKGAARTDESIDWRLIATASLETTIKSLERRLDSE